MGLVGERALKEHLKKPNIHIFVLYILAILACTFEFLTTNAPDAGMAFSILLAGIHVAFVPVWLGTFFAGKRFKKPWLVYLAPILTVGGLFLFLSLL